MFFNAKRCTEQTIYRRVQADGSKKVIERSWFSRGNKLLLYGIRRGDNFIPKIYKNGCGLSSPIILIDDDMNLVYSRADEEE